MNTSFAIGIPTLNRWDLLQPSLLFYTKHDFPTVKIFIVDNGNQGIAKDFIHPNVTVLTQEKNIGVAASWNLLCTHIFEHHDNALILNDDIYFGKRDWEIEEFIRNYRFDLCVSTQDFCSFMIKKQCFIKVGLFDEDFYPAYYEDNDYKHRVRLKGLNVWNTHFVNPTIYRSSQTLEKDPLLNKAIQKNKHRYIDKWGGLPDQEKFKSPFNKKQ